MVVYAVIVTYNGSKWIEECITSILQSSIEIGIIVIDNNSDDNTIDLINKTTSSAEIIKLKKNIGFGKANNIGIKEAIKKKSDYILLINQDAAIQKETITKLISVFKDNPEYGILSPIQYYNYDHLDYQFLNYLKWDNTPLLVNDHITGKVKDVYSTTFVNAAIWLITKDCVNKTGGFAPIFHMYGEDNNYLNRSSFFGYKIGVVPKATGFHYRNQASKNLNIRQKINAAYTDMLVELMNPNQSVYKALRRILGRYLLKSALKEIFLTCVILVYNGIKLLFQIRPIILLRKKSYEPSTFLNF
jgi:GT2 family glycosyltransferase